MASTFMIIVRTHVTHLTVVLIHQ